MTAQDEAAGVPADGTSEDLFLGDRLRILQPRRGYRAGLDAVLLAAAAPVGPGSGVRVLDAGAGVGVVGLCVAARCDAVAVTLVERERQLAALARANVARNGLDARVAVIEADVCASAGELDRQGLAAETFDHVLANPPFLTEGHGHQSRLPLKAGAHAMPAGGLERWARFLARMTMPGGTVSLVHRADALPAVLSALERRFGALAVLPLHPRAGEAAHRIIVSGVKGSRAPLTLLPGLVLHGPDSRFLPEAEAALRGGARIGPAQWRGE